MKELTYKLIYTPSKDSSYGAEEKGFKFLCADNKIHVRLREYDKEEVISGFINKLTYLVTYLKNYTNYDIEIIRLDKLIGSCLHESNYSGIEVLPCYRKVKEYSRSGNLPYNLCPYSNGLEKCSLIFFIDSLKISLYDFLFNDAYELIISKDYDSSNIYKKYISKNNSLVKNKKKLSISLW